MPVPSPGPGEHARIWSGEMTEKYQHTERNVGTWHIAAFAVFESSATHTHTPLRSPLTPLRAPPPPLLHLEIEARRKGAGAFLGTALNSGAKPDWNLLLG